MSPEAPPAPPQLTHQRQLIREKVAALLVDKTDAGKRVWPSRVRHFEARKLPAIGVYTLEEPSRLADVSPRRYERTVTVRVECLAAADEGLDNALDTIAAQVEAVLLADPTWGGTAEDSALVRTVVDFAGDAETVMACLAMEWEADYATSPGQPDPDTLDDFRRAHVDWDLAPDPDEAIDAQDDIVLQPEPEPEPAPEPQPEP